MVEVANTPWHVFSAMIVFGLGALLGEYLRRSFNLPQGRSFLLYLWHTIFCLVYMLFALKNGADAINYYHRATSGGIEFRVGTAFVDYFVFVIIKGTGLSFLGTSLVFNIFGIVGLFAFDASLRQATWNKKKKIRQWATLMVFLPSVSFWSSAIGKDSLAFMATGLALWAALNLRKRAVLMAISIVVMLSVRPHMAAIMIVAIFVSMMVQKGIPLPYRLTIGIVALIASYFIVPLTLHYVNLNNVDPNSVVEYVKVRQGYNLRGGSSFDVSSMSLPMKIFTYMFRPLPFEAHNISSLLASLDNLLLFVFFFWSLKAVIKRKSPSCYSNRTFLWIFSGVSLIALATTTANLGIAVRQKWMFVPMFIFLALTVIGRAHVISLPKAAKLFLYRADA